MYQALYRKYRPKTFADVVGQDVIIKTLSNSITKNMVSHAYLFTGPRGTGKTSVAKIFAKILNCDDKKGIVSCETCTSCAQMNNNQSIDVIEIDAASNNGVDEIREIRNKVGLVPSNSKYKIYIIDEVHMLTNQAFNALLKTLEEPPSHIIFVFATTEPHKIPKTILSRCQRYDFKRISSNNIVERLKIITEREKIEITEDALYEIALLSDGGMRDSISILDQAISYTTNKINIHDIHDINGSIGKEEVRKIIDALLNNDLASIFQNIEEYENKGKNISKIIQELIEEFKNIIIFYSAPKFFNNNESFYEEITKRIDNKQIYDYIRQLAELLNVIKNSNNGKILFEIELIKMIEIKENTIKKIDNEIKPSEKNIKKEEKPKNEKIIKNEKIKQKELNRKEKDVHISDMFAELKKIRVNNSLVSVSQKKRTDFKEKMETLKELLMNPEYSKIISLLFDGDFKAISDYNLVFVYKTSLLAEAFNMEIPLLEKIFYDCFDEKYYLIAVSVDEWNEIKAIYNKNKENYKYIQEDIDFNKIYNELTVEEKAENKNVIDQLFENIIEYE